MEKLTDRASSPLPFPFDTTCFTSKGVFSGLECNKLINMLQNPTRIDTSKSGDVVRIVERTSLKVILLLSTND